MNRAFKSTLIALVAGLVMFVATGTIAYAMLWRAAGLDKLSPEDSAAAALGSFSVLLRGICWGFTFGLLTFGIVVWKHRRRRPAKP